MPKFLLALAVASASEKWQRKMKRRREKMTKRKEKRFCAGHWTLWSMWKCSAQPCNDFPDFDGV